MPVTIIGGGLAGCEAALCLADLGIDVILKEAKPQYRSEAHSSRTLAEVVCSNSFKSVELSSAHGLLKAELARLGCRLTAIAEECRVPAGSALAVDREAFSEKVTAAVTSHKNITLVCEKVSGFDTESPTILAGGPLILSPLDEFLAEITGDSLHFYDASAPIISADSIDYEKAFTQGRYGKGDDYINCPLTEAEYREFIAALTTAETVIPKEFEKSEIFEGCMPVEVMAKRGVDSLRFGPLKPVGLSGNDGKRPYAVVQLRRENALGDMYNLVGFQTNLKFAEQKRVFSMIPALAHAEFLRYGVMHRNSYIDAPRLINRDFSLRRYPNVFIAGQLSGVEGYVESIMSGRVAALGMAIKLKGGVLPDFPEQTIIGAITRYLTADNADFQPINANFGLLPPVAERIRDKKLRKEAASLRALEALDGYLFDLKRLI